MLGISRSSTAALLTQLGQLGNLLVVTPGTSFAGQGQLPGQATGTIRRIAPVRDAASTGLLPHATVRRTDKINPLLTGGIAVQAADPNLPTALGIAHAYPHTQVLLGNHWFTVIGILQPAPISPEIDRSVLIGYPIAQSLLGFDGNPTTIYVRVDPDPVDTVRGVLARTAKPDGPDQVQVSRPSDALAARIATNGSTSDSAQSR